MATRALLLVALLGGCSEAKAGIGLGPGASLSTALPGSLAAYYAGDATHNPNTSVIDVSGFNGDSLAGVKVQGWIGTLNTITQPVYWVLEPNNDQTLQATTGTISTSLGCVITSQAASTTWSFQFAATMTPSKTGAGNRVLTIANTNSDASTDSNVCTWTNTADQLVSFRFKAISSVDGSEVRQSTIAATNPGGQPSLLTWQSVGN